MARTELWWQGPIWLTSEEWPEQPILDKGKEVEDEEIKTVLQVTTIEKEKGLLSLIRPKDKSSKRRLLGITAWVMRFIKNCKAKDKLKERYLTTEEVIEAETIWTKMVQTEIEESPNYPQLVKQLNIVKINGIMRCKGRLKFSELSFESQNPALLPKEHGYTDLVVKEAHNVVLHGLVNMTLAEVRQRYWIPKGRQVCKRIIKQCKDCAKRRSKALKGTVTAPLPEVHVKPARPFAVTGCDFTGPIYLQNNEKSYVALFTCAVTRAVHLELTRDMTALEFRVILQRFASRRGAPSTVISDKDMQQRRIARLSNDKTNRMDIQCCKSTLARRFF